MFGLGDCGACGIGDLGVHNAGMFGLGDVGDVGDLGSAGDFGGETSNPTDPSVIMSGGGGGSVSGSGVDYTSIINALTQGAVAGSAIYRNLQPPSVIPGSGVLYDPATGRLISASGVSLPGGTLGTSLTTAGLGISSGAILAIGGILLAIMLAKK